MILRHRAIRSAAEAPARRPEPRPRATLALAALLLFIMTHATAGDDVEDFWEYDNPAASEQRFRAALGSGGTDRDLELQTQIARTYSLRRRFDEAHRILDQIQPALPSASARVQSRYLLERGRTLRSAGDKEAAQPLFLQAYDVALGGGAIGLAVDAAHMLALVTPSDTATAWTNTGIRLARSSSDSKARALLPALLNNHAWNLHDAGRFDDALPVFIEAETAWRATGKQPQGRIATWSVARCLRSLGRHDEALALQRKLAAEWSADGGSDGYVFEEIAENLDALGRPAEARSYYARAARELGKDPSFVRDEPARLQRLIDRAGR
jgi:tetratricopeptide (TPR) repeat protein